MLRLAGGMTNMMSSSLFKRTSNSFCKFVRDRPHLNVGTIGHVDHGKTTLTSAITKVCAEKGLAAYSDYKSIDKTKEEQERGITISTTTLEYVTDKRHYGHVDCPGHEDYVKNMITGAAKMDAGILVVAATDGAMPQTREHILLCKQVGVKTIIVFINKCDLVKDPEMYEIIEMDVRDILTKYGFDGDSTKFVKGSALLCLEGKEPELGIQRVEELLDIMDNDIPIPERNIDKPFLMAIESTYNIKGRGTVITGTIEQGKVKIGEEIELVGYSATPVKTTITGIETFRKQLDRGEAGDNVGILIRNITRENAGRGIVVCKPGSQELGQCFQAQVYLLKEEEGGRKNSFTTGFRPQIFLRTADVATDVILPSNAKVAMPGDSLNVHMRLASPLALEKGLHFALRESGKTIGHGVITKVLPKTAIPDQVSKKIKDGTIDPEQLSKDLEKL